MEMISCDICGAEIPVLIEDNAIKQIGNPKVDKNSNAFSLVETQKKISKLQNDLSRSQKTNTKLQAEVKKLKGDTHVPARKDSQENRKRRAGEQESNRRAEDKSAKNSKCRFPWEWFGD